MDLFVPIPLKQAGSAQQQQQQRKQWHNSPATRKTLLSACLHAPSADVFSSAVLVDASFTAPVTGIAVLCAAEAVANAVSKTRDPPPHPQWAVCVCWKNCQLPRATIWAELTYSAYRVSLDYLTKRRVVRAKSLFPEGF